MFNFPGKDLCRILFQRGNTCFHRSRVGIFPILRGFARERQGKDEFRAHQDRLVGRQKGLVVVVLVGRCRLGT